MELEGEGVCKQEKEIRGILAFFFQSIKFKQPVNGH